MDKTPRIPIPVGVRSYVLARDGHQCQSCSQSHVPLEVDHIIPLAKGGPNDISNLHTLCQRCNRKKCDRIDPQFQRRYL
ncbi:HNH endonuclease [Acaryochloris thomasi]|uniref:HNH endonuclease n=1 Tax=Acaryochloris thomasi TaxID=2929456 RepID=UPI000DA6A4CC|nr:HNH endonuclease [Acaryochloris thomasi]